MANPVQHASVPKVHMHDPYRWIVADESARLALTTTAADLNKWARQSSDNTVWELTSSGPSVWVHVGGLEEINDAIDDLYSQIGDIATALNEINGEVI